MLWTHLRLCAVVVGVCRSQPPPARAGRWPHFDPGLKLAQSSAGHRGPPVPWRCVGLLEECCSWSSEHSAEKQVGPTSVCCVGLVVEERNAGTEAAPCQTVGPVAVLVLLLFFSSPDLL